MKLGFIGSGKMASALVQGVVQAGVLSREAIAVSDAITSVAEKLASAAGVVDGFSRAFVAAAIVAVLLAVVAFVKMPSTHVTGGGGNLHMH